MKTRDLNTAIAGANPVDPRRLDGLPFAAMEADLLVDLDADLPALFEPAAERPRPRLQRRFVLTLGSAAVAFAVVVFFLVGGRSDHPSPVYGAQLVRFAESTPLLLLEEPGWRVQNVTQAKGREGSMEFVTGPPVPYESTTVSAGGAMSGMAPRAVRQRKVELSWRMGKLVFAGPAGVRPIQAPVLDTTALVDTNAATLYISTKTGKRQVDLGGPGDRQMVAIWKEDGLLLEMRAWVPDLAAFEERLGWLTRVDPQTWLDAMPAKVVKAADHDATVREMLKGIPVPDSFEPSQVPDEGLTTNRYQVGAAVTGTVSCLWFRQWGEARRTGDRQSETEAEKAMASARHWAILREMAKDGAYPQLVWELAAEMPGGYWEWSGHKHPLLPRAEGLGCARWGIPVLPWKQRLQRERQKHQRGGGATASSHPPDRTVRSETNQRLTIT